jgi:hypothetical protein
MIPPNAHCSVVTNSQDTAVDEMLGEKFIRMIL